MRDIKFRVWSKESKKMYLPKKGCDFLVRIDGEYFVDEDIVENVGLIPVKKDDSVLMQYTGLKDKNGKEIYEGDIVKVNGELMEVFFKDGYFGWGKEHSGAYSFDPFGAEQLEIIGNIYENPNLLKEEK